jgi:hypothetical protein
MKPSFDNLRRVQISDPFLGHFLVDMTDRQKRRGSDRG